MNRLELALGVLGTVASMAALFGFGLFLYSIYRQEHPR